MVTAGTKPQIGNMPLAVTRDDLVQAASAIYDELAAKLEVRLANAEQSLAASVQGVVKQELARGLVDAIVDKVLEVIRGLPPPHVEVKVPPVRKTFEFDEYGRPTAITEHEITETPTVPVTE